jgi:hypothetical protein
MRWIKTKNSTLAPFDRTAGEFIVGLSGEPIVMQPVDAEETRFRGYVFACINEVAKALREPPDRVRAELLLETGRFKSVGKLFGKSVVAIDSMSRAHMGDAELHAFWAAACDVLRFKVLCRVTDVVERDRLTHRLKLSETEA